MTNDEKINHLDVWLPIVGGPVISLGSFFLIWWLNPFGASQLSEIPAFFVSVVVLVISQWLVTVREIQKTATISKGIHEAVKNYLHVIPVGTPEAAIEYVISRISSLRYVMNTSFTTQAESERIDEKLYQTAVYDLFSEKIAEASRGTIVWKDIGDSSAISRMRRIAKLSGEHLGRHYKYKILGHVDPQMNFIIIEYRDGVREVLFNWDFRGLGRDPVILLSRDSHIVEMFSVHFNLLWFRANDDHDSQATNSVSQQ